MPAPGLRSLRGRHAPHAALDGAGAALGLAPLLLRVVVGRGPVVRVVRRVRVRVGVRRVWLCVVVGVEVGVGVEEQGHRVDGLVRVVRPVQPVDPAAAAAAAAAVADADELGLRTPLFAPQPSTRSRRLPFACLTSLNMSSACFGPSTSQFPPRSTRALPRPTPPNPRP